MSYNGTGNDYTATTVFAFTDDMLVQSNYVFVPYDVQFSSWDHVTGGPDGYYTSYDGDAYIDGAEVTMDIEVNDTLVGTDLVLKRGFYTYTITDGVVSLENRVTTDNEACFYLENYDVKVERTATGWEINDVDVVKEPTIVDCRNTDYTTIETMQQLYEGYELNWPGYTGADLKLTIGYTLNGDGDVQYIYVVDSAWHNELTVELGSNMGTGYWNVSNVIWQDHVNGDDISFDMIWLQTNDRTDEVVAFNYTLSYVDEDGDPQTVTDTVFGTFNGKVCPITIEAVDIDWDQDAVLTINEAEFAEAMTLKLSDDVSGKDMADYYAAPSTEPIYGVVGETISINVVYTAHDVVVDTNDTITVNGTACTITNVKPVGNTQVITFSYEVVDNVTTLTIGGINVNA